VPDLCNELRRRGGCNCVIQKVDLDSKNEKILHLYVRSIPFPQEAELQHSATGTGGGGNKHSHLFRLSSSSSGGSTTTAVLPMIMMLVRAETESVR
jgi:hypothetical protein